MFLKLLGTVADHSKPYTFISIYLFIFVPAAPGLPTWSSFGDQTGSRDQTESGTFSVAWPQKTIHF